MLEILVGCAVIITVVLIVGLFVIVPEIPFAVMILAWLLYIAYIIGDKII